MARSSTVDPVEKFRFRVTVIAIDVSVTGGIDTASGLFGDNPLGILTRAGFSEVTSPASTNKTITYRENLDAQRFTKTPGLTNYDPVTLRRGVTENRDLYNWYRLVNDDIALLNVAQELSREQNFTVIQSENFRKDVIIEVLDRVGDPIKAWYLFNSFPTSYRPGNGLNADANEKLIEELVLDYEFFLELEGGPEGFAREIATGGLVAAAGEALNRLPFNR